MPHIDYGGVEKNIYILSNYLSQNSMQVELLTCNNDMKKMFGKKIQFIGTKNKFWQKSSKKVKYIICLFLLLLNLLSKNKNTVVIQVERKFRHPVLKKVLKS